MDWLRREMLEPEIELGGANIPIVIKRHARARRMTLRLAPDGSEARITIPNWARTKEAIDFVHSRQDWLEKQQAKVLTKSEPVPGDTIRFRGEPLTINWQEDAPRKCQFTTEHVILGGPRASMLRRLQRALEEQALALFEADRDEYCKLANVAPAPVKLSRPQKRWGSCSTAGDIRLNWRLVQAPDFVRRSVVAHEVAHLVHFDHSTAFHQLLDQIFEGDLVMANAWLRDNGRTLFVHFG